MKRIITMLTKKKRRLILVGMVAALAVFLVPHLAFAQEAQTTQSAESLYQQLVQFLIVMVEFLQRLIWPVLLMIGGLLKNDLLFAAGMEEVMLSIWENIRNIVNILFVIILLGIAFYNVLGGSSQDYHIKTILPRFVIALIAVNFSFLGVKVVLDGVNVISTAIFALPGAVEKSLESSKTPNFEKNICEGIYGKDETKYFQAIQAAEEAGQANADDKPFCKQDKTFTEHAQGFFSSFDSHNAAIVLAVNLAEINTLDLVNVNQPSAKELFINISFSTVLYIVYAVSFVALLIILLVRLVVLWVTMVMSPLIALSFVLPESLKSSLGSGSDLKTQFVKNAIVPIPVALTMSIGFIMLQSLKQAKFTNITFETSTLGVNLLTSGLSTLQDVIVAVGTVTVIWVGVFKAAEGTAAQSIVEKIKGATEGFGKFVATAPFKYAPIIPVKEGGGEKVSVGTALGALREIPYQLERGQQEKASALAGRYSGAALEETGKKLEAAKSPKEFMQELVNVSRGQEGSKPFQQQLGESLRKKGPTFTGQLDWKELGYKNPQEAIEALRKGEVDQEKLRKWIDANAEKLSVKQQAITPPTAQPGTPGPHPAGSGAQGKTGPAAGTPAEKGAAAAGAAIVTLGAATALAKAPNLDKRKAALSDTQQKALDKFNADNSKLADEDVQDALKQLQQIDSGSQEFATDLSGALAIEDKEKKDKQVVQVVLERKKTVRAQIKTNNPDMDEAEINKRVNQIVQDEIDKAPGIDVKAEDVKEEKT